METSPFVLLKTTIISTLYIMIARLERWISRQRNLWLNLITWVQSLLPTLLEKISSLRCSLTSTWTLVCVHINTNTHTYTSPRHIHTHICSQIHISFTPPHTLLCSQNSSRTQKLKWAVHRVTFSLSWLLKHTGITGSETWNSTSCLPLISYFLEQTQVKLKK